MVCAAILLAPASARAATITVNSTSDAAASDDVCTLREAILAANTNTASGGLPGECVAGAPGLDTIAFNIPGAGVRTITPATPLPAITEVVSLNGYTQPGTSPNTNALNAGINAVILIELNGSTAGGLTVNASGSVIRGLNVHGTGDVITLNASNVIIAGNFLGTNPAGTADGTPGGGGFGIRLVSGDNNIFGGAADPNRNLVSGSGQGAIALNSGNGTLIQGNYIGTDVTGTLAINGLGSREGIRGSPTSNTVILSNLISGNSAGGVTTGDPGGRIQGNLIGTQRDGVSPLGNGTGIRPFASGFLIGGPNPGQGNTIAFNQIGVLIDNNFVGDGILGNSIFSNGDRGIALTGVPTPLLNDSCDSDTLPGNRGQNYPVITSAPIAAGNVTISGTLNSTASTTFRIEFFSNVTADPSGNGEGQTFLGFASVTTDATCNAAFGPLVFAVPPGQAVFSATATDPAGNTSEFSAAFTAAAPPSADLSVTKVASPDPVMAGGSITYVIGVANGGPSAAANVSLTDTLPANTTFVSFAAPAGWTPTTPPVGGSGTVTATSGSLASGGTASFTLVVQVNGGAPGGTVISNTAGIVSGTTADPNGANNSASVRTTVAAAGLAVQVPTLPTWALAAFALLLGAFGWIGARRGA